MVVLPNGELDWRCGRDEPEVKINACYRILRFRFHHQNQVVHNGQFQGIQCPLLTSMGTCVHGVHIYICKKTHEIKYNFLENRILSTYVVICRNILFLFFLHEHGYFQTNCSKNVSPNSSCIGNEIPNQYYRKKKRKMEINARDRGTLGIEYVVFSLSGAARRKK